MTGKDETSGKGLGDELKPHPEHPIFSWSWYELPGGNGYLVIPAHVPFPGDPIEFPEKPEPVPPPTAEQIPSGGG